MKDPRRFVCVPAHARLNHARLLKAMRELQLMAKSSDLNNIESGSNMDAGIITSGVTYTYVKEALTLLDLDYSVLKIGMSNPLPEDFIGNYLQKFKRVIIIEEGEPYLETFIQAIASARNLRTRILGKRYSVTPYEGELDVKKVKSGILNALIEEKVIDDDGITILEEIPEVKPELLLNRPPILCAGCPHRGTFYALNKVTGRGKKAVISTDIGCYTLGVQPPIKVGDMVICMGSSIGIANGLSHTGVKESVVAIIGDSTFWHSGLTELASAVYNKANMTIVIVDNSTTAMTGMQDHPGTGKTAAGIPTGKLSLMAAAKALGAGYVRNTSAFDVKETAKILKEALAFDGTAVVISEGACMINQMRARRRLPEEEKAKLPKTMQVDPEKCIGCGTCIMKFGCPAIWWSDRKTDKGKPIPKVDPTLCQPCGVCADVCPVGAFYETEEENY
ncbi:MAG: thiamine pyrophosphate-dependent enzyme, partial [Candidatus Hodarchaeales archaeon]